MNRGDAVLVVVAVLAFSGCASSREHWVYGLSRKAYPALCNGNRSWVSFGDLKEGRTGTDPRELLFIPAILVFPFVLDTVLLPITVPRDLYVYR
jgi:uncharacterized protein YceK